MATIKITIEDKLNGRVNVKMNPNGLEIATLIKSGAPTTSAHGLALAALNAILREQKNQEKNNPKAIITPKLLS